MSTTPIANADPFGIQMMKPTKAGGQIWYMYNTDFNDDPQVYTESATLEYRVHNVVDADGSRFSLSASNAFKTYISPTSGLDSTRCITDQQEMARRGYMQDPQDWRNVEFTGQFVIFQESANDFITFGFRGGKHAGSGSPTGCTACTYLVEIAMTKGGLIRVRKKSWNISIHNWLSGLASGFDATKICGWTLKILCYNTQDAKSVNIEVWLAPLNDNHFTKVLSGVDTGQLNTDATTCKCTIPGQPLTWGAPAILMQGNTGIFGFKNITIREIEGYGATLPPVDPGSGGGGDPGSGSGSGSGGSGGGGTPVDLTPVLATPHTSYTKYGGGPQYNPLDFYVIFAGSDWNKAPPTATPGVPTTTTVTADPILATPQTDYIEYGGANVDQLEFWFIFPGSAWNSGSNLTRKNQIIADMKTLFNNSHYFDHLIQYRWTRKPTLKGFVTNTTFTLVNPFNGPDINNLIFDCIAHNQFPEPTATHMNTVFFVCPLPGVISVGGSGVGGSHGVDDQYKDTKGYYLWQAFAIYVSDYTFQTQIITEEIVESMTDNFNGYFASESSPLNQSLGPEINDVCHAAGGSNVSAVISGITVAKYWSDQDGACIAPTSATKPSWISCPAGYTYDLVEQICKKTVTTTPPPGAPPDPTKSANTTLKTQVQNSITSVFQSNYFAGLLQYGLAKKPVLKGFVVATTPPANTIKNNYTAANIETFIADCVTKSLVPVNKQAGPKNIAYMVILPPNMKGSPTGSVGEHWSHDLSPVSITDPNLQWFYFISTATLVTTFDDFTDTISHEFTETIADTITIGDRGYVIKPGTPLDAKVAAHGNDICDVCEDEPVASLNGVFVAKYWSDQDGACIIPPSTTNPTPWATCHTGAIWDNSTQTCKLQPTSGGGGTTPTSGHGGYPITSATASSDDGHKPAQAVDGKLDTRWSGFGKGQFLTLSLGTTAKKVDKVKIAWYQGDQRSNKFEIHTSVDGTTFTKALGMDSVKGSTGLTDYAITPLVTIKAIKIIVNGNTQNDWASISEVEIWGPDVPSTTPGTGSGGDPGSGGQTGGGDTGGGTTTPPPPTEASYNFFDTSFSCDYHKIGLCNPVE